MTVFTRTWDGSYEAVPANVDAASQGAQRIREFKVDFRERFTVDHSTAGDTADGEHKKITFHSQIVDPTPVANKGFLYIKDAAGKAELHFEDEDGNVVKITAAGTINAVAYAHPAGIVSDFAGTTEPAGWLLCAGQDVSRTTYSLLFAAIGTLYGAGNGSTTFTLPDYRGRVLAGQDDMGGTSANRLTGLSGGVDGDTLGAVGGAETHSLTSAQSGLPDHTHSEEGVTALSESSGGGEARFISSSQQTGGVTGGAQNASAAHNNVQPTAIANKIISTGGQV